MKCLFLFFLIPWYGAWGQFALEMRPIGRLFPSDSTVKKEIMLYQVEISLQNHSNDSLFFMNLECNNRRYFISSADSFELYTKDGFCQSAYKNGLCDAVCFGNSNIVESLGPEQAYTQQLYVVSDKKPSSGLIRIGFLFYYWQNKGGKVDWHYTFDVLWSNEIDLYAE